MLLLSNVLIKEYWHHKSTEKNRRYEEKLHISGTTCIHVFFHRGGQLKILGGRPKTEVSVSICCCQIKVT